MPKKAQLVTITPIPAHIPRQLAIDMLHSHGEIIELNPLVLEHHPIKAPRDAPADEFFSVWHEISERIQYIPGMGKMGSGKINFRGVFHDLPNGLQTHIYAPAGVDLRNKYTIRGNQPGEPPEPRELGSAAPAEGLYLRDEIEIKCNFTMVPFVKSQTKAASKTMIDRLVKKAELIDAEILRQMMEAHQRGGPNSSTSLGASNSPQLPPNSPGLSPGMPYSPDARNPNDYKRHTMLSNSDVLRKREEALRTSIYHSTGSIRSTHGGGGHPSPGLQPPNNMMEMMGSVPEQKYNQQPGSGLAIEMMGDTQFNYAPPAKASPGLAPPGRQSTYSELDGSHGNSGSRPNSIGPENMTSVSSGWGGSQGGRESESRYSPRMEQQQQQQQQQQPHQQQQFQQGGGGGSYRYNPRDFVQELPANGQQ